MNKKALIIGLVYALSVIIFKLFILLGGHTLSKFGFYYSNIVATFFIIPFFFLAIYLVREKDYNGVIGGKEAIRIALTVLAVGVVFLSVYNYMEFNWKYKDIATQYYTSDDYLQILKTQQAKHPDKLKTEDFPKIIQEQITGLSAFKATTGKLIPLLFIGLSGAFIASVLLKKR
jgi:hypothetical protein